MKKIAMLLTALALLHGAVFSAGNDVGRVSGISGIVKAQGAALRLLGAVARNERIEVGPGSSVKVIFYADNHEEQATGPCTVSAADRGFTVVKGGASCLAVTRKVPARSLPANFSGRGRSIGSGLMRGGAYLKVTSDVLEAPLHPTFRWKHVPEAASYAFSLSEVVDGRQGKPLASVTLRENSYALPCPLEEGRQYSCLVTANASEPPDPDADALAENTAFPYAFTVAGREMFEYLAGEEKKLSVTDRNDPEWLSSALVLINLYIEYGATDRAGRLARELKAVAPDEDYVRNLIRLYYID